MTKVDFDARELLDPRMVSNLLHIKEHIRKNFDWVTVIHGHEGYGKSTLAHLCNAVVDDDYDVAHVVYQTSELRYCIAKSPKYRVVNQDEGIESWMSTDANTSEGRKITKMFMQVRARNLYFNINIPDAGKVNVYLKTHRANCVLRVIKRGVFAFYSDKRAAGIRKDSNTKRIIWPKPCWIGYFKKIPESSEFWKEYERKDLEHKFSTKSENPKVIEKELQMERFFRDTVDFKQAAKMVGVSPGTIAVWQCRGVLKKRFRVKPIKGPRGWRLTIGDVQRLNSVIWGNQVNTVIKKTLIRQDYSK